MFFEKIVSDLSEVPLFNVFSFPDVNPVSGRKKWRKVAAPNQAMKTLQLRFLQYLRANQNEKERKELLRHATSSNPGDSPLKNVQPHRQNRYFYLVDFTNAYRSVDAANLASILVRLKIFNAIPVEELYSLLEKYFFHEKLGLVPGGNASQDLFNLYVGALVDVPLEETVRKSNITYTRFIDDLTFSSSEPIRRDVRKAIREVISRAGFMLNHRKCECIDLKKRTTLITGIGIADKGRLFVPRPYARKVRGLIHRAKTDKRIDVQRITGMVQAIRQLSSEQGANAFEQKILNEYHALLHS